MDSNPSVKCLRNECIDRISDLPDAILGKILSYLSTRKAVATSILSTRWKILFPAAVPLIRLDLDDSYTSDTPSRNFMNFVDKLLNVDLRDATCVERVVFSCINDYGDEKIVSWVCAILRLNVKHLRLMSYLSDSEALFNSLNGCKTLVELELGNNFDLCLPEEYILPNLKRLLLNQLILGDERNSLHRLLNGCPVLNFLSIIGCKLGDTDTIYIQHPSVNRLFIDGSFNKDRCRVVIDAPNLEDLGFEGRFVANYALMNMNSLHSVCIDYDYFFQQNGWGRLHANSLRLAEFIEACSMTTLLRLAGDSVEGLCLFSWFSVPKFQNLTSLALGRMGAFGWGILTEFLESAPNLTVLTFEEELESICSLAFDMSTLRSLPSCMELNLKKIEIWEFGWTLDEIELVKYFLENGKVLEELIVHCLPYDNASKLEKLSMLPKHSKACQLLLKDKKEPEKPCYSRESWFQTRHA